jgi:hypothetical protein
MPSANGGAEGASVVGLAGLEDHRLALARAMFSGPATEKNSP